MFWRKSKFVANVIEERCCNCGCCVRICHHHALKSSEIQEKMSTFLNAPDRCTGCEKCLRICPNEAIEMVERYC